MTNIFKKITLLLREAFNHANPIIRWLTVKPLLLFKMLALGALITGIINIFLQLAGFWIFYHFLGLFQTKWKMVLWGMHYDLSQYKYYVFWVVGILVFTTYILGAVFTYLNRLIITKIGTSTEREYRNLISKIYIGYLTNSTKALNISKIKATEIKAFYVSGGRYAGRVIMAIINSAIPVITMFIAFGLLFYLRPLLTMSFVVILLFFAPLYIIVGRRGMSSGNTLNIHAKQATLTRNTYIDAIRYSAAKEMIDSSKLDGIVNSYDTEQFIKVYEFRLRVGAISASLTKLVQAFMLIIILGGVVYPLLTKFSIKELRSVFIFCVVFKYMVTGLTTLSATLIVVHIYYSYCKSMILFFDNYRNKKKKSVCNAQKPTGSNGNLLNPGKPIVMGIDSDIDRSIIGSSLFLLLDKDTRLYNEYFVRSYLFSSVNPITENDIYKELGINKELLNWHPDLTNRFKPLIENIMERQALGELNSSEWNKIPLALKLICFAYRYSKGNNILFIDGNAFIALLESEQKLLLSILSSNIIIIAFGNKMIPEGLEKTDITTAVWIKGDTIIWKGQTKEANKYYPGAETTAGDDSENVVDMDLEI